MKRQLKPNRSGTSPVSGLKAILRRLIATSQNPAHLLELYYWSAEPELMNAIRQYVALPEKPRAALMAFLTMTADCPETVQVTVTKDGYVTLYSPALAGIIARMEHLKGVDECAESVH
jgi:hypothetical protein